MRTEVCFLPTSRFLKEGFWWKITDFAPLFHPFPVQHKIQLPHTHILLILLTLHLDFSFTYYTVMLPCLTLYLLTWRIWWAPNNASKGQMGFNSALKGLMNWTTEPGEQNKNICILCLELNCCCFDYRCILKCVSLNRKPVLDLFNTVLYDSPPTPQSNSHNKAEHFTQYLCSWPGHFLFLCPSKTEHRWLPYFQELFPVLYSAERIPQNFYPVFSVTEVFSYFHWHYNGYSCLILHCPDTIPDTISNKTAILFFHTHWATYSNIHHCYRHSHVSLAVCSNNPPIFLVPPY